MSRHEPIVESTPLQPSWPTEDHTAAFAQRLATLPGLANAVIELHGDLGAGKTSFARHLLRALGIEGRIKSPTYAILEPYATAGGLRVSHFDFYRFNDPREWEDAGFRDVFAAPGLKIVEWPERAASMLPAPDLRIHIEARADESRAVRIEAGTASGRQMLRELAR